jgi:hypothetical protein
MVISRVQANFQTPLPQIPVALRKFGITRLFALFVWLLVLMSAVYAQTSTTTTTAEEKVVHVNGVTDSTVFGIGSSVRVSGTVKQGAMSFGGDVIVEGIVEGDVAAIGGDVIQRAGSRIGGDVIVLGGTYHADASAQRNPNAETIMYAGYQQELRDMMRDPTGLLSPRWSPTFLGTRLLVVLFWFIVSLALTAVMPGTISRGVARLQLTSLRVATIGFIGVVVLFASVGLTLWIMPEPIRVLVGLLALLLLLVASVFGRVILYAATGRWLQRKYISFGKNSEAVALLLGTSFWVLLTSLPYVWPLLAISILIISFGLALTARYRVGWKSV